MLNSSRIFLLWLARTVSRNLNVQNEEDECKKDGFVKKKENAKNSTLKPNKSRDKDFGTNISTP